MDAVATAKEKMTKTVAALERDLGTLKAGRANPQALDRIMVDYYGSQVPINQLGNISSPEARLLVISPYDATMIKEIEKAIQKSRIPRAHRGAPKGACKAGAQEGRRV